MTDKRTHERELIIPALEILAESADIERGIPTEYLARQLRTRIKPSKEDLEILRGRKDDRLSQVIRNLVSHRTLEKRGFATYQKDPFDGRGYYRLTDMGRRTLKESLPLFVGVSTSNWLTD